ncbi:MAG: hypothetical protein ABSF92_10075 [Candidatus Acidiferrales bacterium]
MLVDVEGPAEIPDLLRLGFEVGMALVRQNVIEDRQALSDEVKGVCAAVANVPTFDLPAR